LADKPILLVVSEADGGDCSVPSQLDEQYEVVRVETPLAALSEMARRPLAGVFVDAGHLGAVLQIERLLESDRILEGMPDGVVLLDSDNIIIWGNGRLREWGDQESVVGKNFYSVLGSPEIIGPDFCPFHTVLATGKPSGSTLRTASNRATFAASSGRWRCTRPQARPPPASPAASCPIGTP
jgi:PAS domain-containing protein